MGSLSHIQGRIDYALSGHSAPDKLSLLVSEYERLSKDDQIVFIEALGLRYLTVKARLDSKRAPS